MKKFIFILAFCLSPSLWAINIGFNQAWFHNNYATQFLDGSFDAQEVERIFKLAHEARARSVRLWIFESHNLPMLEWQENQITGIRPDFIRNMVTTLELARKHQVQIYLTLFDAHSYRPDQLEREALKTLRSLFQPEGGEIFLTKALSPLLRAIAEASLQSVVDRIDLINEGDTIVNRLGFNWGWIGAGKMICRWRNFIQSQPGFDATPITMSIRLHPMLPLPLNLFSQKGPMACADFLDFHSYQDEGKIHQCQRLKKYADKNLKPLFLGEFGQSYFTERYDDELQLKNTQNYIKNAEACGFKEALAWRLSDIRPGYNKEARYSFEADGKMRPAFELIRQHNQP